MRQGLPRIEALTYLTLKYIYNNDPDAGGRSA